MPFRCDIRLDATNLGGPIAEPARLEAWLIEPKRIVEPETPIALLDAAGRHLEVRIRFRCFIERLAAAEGDVLQADQLLLQVMADGEEIPSGFAYCTLQQGDDRGGGVTVLRLTDADRERVIDVLAAAFHGYPVMRYVLSDAGAGYGRRLRALIGYFCDARFSRGWPVLGARRGSDLVAAALVSAPVYVPPSPALEEERARMPDRVGHGAWERMARYERESSGLGPGAPHYFLGMIGVIPREQGRGYAGRLLERLHAMSEADPASTGVSLSTEDPANVSYYERAGYRVLAEADVGAIHTWCMFRPDGE